MTIPELKLLTDIKVAIESIDIHLEHKRDFTAYLANKTKRRAVERELEIVGEAMNNPLKLNPSIPPFLCKSHCEPEKPDHSCL